MSIIANIKICDICIATEIKNKIYKRINVLRLNVPNKINVAQSNAIEVKISGII